eukprot:CAMPEP_0196209646 /NCGR_PEP_ID=MMETSP0912-20130531/9800_1 /TAXON_ID=49265 /ORGANISM="Thalassiosira rotula, Strain GSO102" /LENGTH=105 /DNA_ID=CAMNT_0041484603 /DNA_START=152 /DNA_END=465 /DNA_ORIENTATION=-
MSISLGTTLRQVLEKIHEEVQLVGAYSVYSSNLSATMASTALRMLAAGAPISLGTHNLEATTRAADAASFALFSISGNIEPFACDIASPSDSSKPTTKRSTASAG